MRHPVALLFSGECAKIFSGMTPEEFPPVPQPATPTAEPKVFLLKENGKPASQWTLTIHSSHLSLADAPGAQPYAILREHFKKEVSFLEGIHTLGIAKPVKVFLRLSPAAEAALADWLGKPFLAAYYLKRRYAWLLPWAILWMLGTLLMLLPAPEGQPQVPFDPVSFVLGITLLISCLLARWRPHPALFLVDGLWFATISLRWAGSLMFEERSAWWLIFVALLAWMAVTGFRHFFRFRGVKLVPQPK
jgi:hypothetical protein